MFHITSLQGSELSQSGRAPPPFRFRVSQLWWEHQVCKLFLKVLVTPKEFHWKIQLKTTKLKGNQLLKGKQSQKKISNIHKNHQSMIFWKISPKIHLKNPEEDIKKISAETSGLIQLSFRLKAKVPGSIPSLWGCENPTFKPEAL